MTDKIEYKKKIVSLASTLKPSPTKSLLLQALNLPSSQSIVIQMGNRLEKFWNFVIDETSISLDTSNCTRQIDMSWKDAKGANYYAESKCNWNLDSDKMPATLKKVEEQARILNATGICFCPVLSKNENVRGREIHGVEWLLKSLQVTAFTSDDYFKWLRVDVRSVI